MRSATLRTRTAIILLGVLSLASGLPAAPVDKPRAAKVLAKAELHDGWLQVPDKPEVPLNAEVSRQPTTAVFRSNAELAKPFGFDPLKEDATSPRKWRLLHDCIATSLGVKELDLDKHMLLAACAGGKSGGGDWRLEFKEVVIQDKKMIVTLVLHPTMNPNAKAINSAAALVLVEKFEGEVLFSTVEAMKGK